MQPIILASQSPRRKQLLEWAEVPFTVCMQHTDEHFPSTLAAEEVPVFIAGNKAAAVKNSGKAGNGEIILAADTIVVLDNDIIGKPADEVHAVSTLMRLSGKRHRVITGVVLLQGEKKVAFADVTEVEFHVLSKEQVAWYVQKYKPFDKAGAYAIQEWIGVVGIRSIKGDFYNVMGLPVSRVVQALADWDVTTGR